jgi:hypothetical protein
MSQLKVTWVDSGFWPNNEPDPSYPKGIDLDISRGNIKTCSTPLPYPAKRCGHFVIECASCGLRVAATTAGRVDDPRSIKVACRLQPH